jgi:hypothetical protein
MKKKYNRSLKLCVQSMAGGEGHETTVAGSQGDVRRKISVPNRPSSFLRRGTSSGSGGGGRNNTGVFHGSIRRRSIKLRGQRNKERKHSSDGAESKSYTVTHSVKEYRMNQQ